MLKKKMLKKEISILPIKILSKKETSILPVMLRKKNPKRNNPINLLSQKGNIAINILFQKRKFILAYVMQSVEVSYGLWPMRTQ